MTRAVAITLAAVTPLFVDIIVFLLCGQLESTLAIIKQFQLDDVRLVTIASNLRIVEYIFLKS